MTAPRSRTLRLIALIIAVSTLAAFTGWRWTTLAEQWPQTVEHVAPPGDTLQIDGIDYEILDATTVLGTSFADQLNGYTSLSPDYPLENQRMVLLTIKATNASNESHTIEWLPFTLRTGAWAAILEIECTRRLDPSFPIEEEVSPGQSTQHTIAYFMMAQHFPAGRWKKVPSRAYSFDLLTYPDYYSMQLPTLREMP